jgi:predicted exporter
MEPARQKWIARALLLAGTAAAAAWLGSIDLGRRISTDVLDLIPSDERSPELSMVRELAGQEEARVILVALEVPARAGETPAARASAAAGAGDAFASALARSPSIAQALLLSDSGPRDALGAAIFAQRMDLLLPAWLEARRSDFERLHPALPWPSWLAERAAADLEGYLAKPEAMAAQDIITADPLLLVPGLVARMGDVSGPGLSPGPSPGRALIWARSRASPLTPEGQGPVFDAVAAALGEVRRQVPDARIQWTSIGRFAAASRARIEHELSLLNLLSLACVVAVAAACVRRAWRALQLVPVVLGSLLGAWAVTTAAWDRVHILVFVVGSLLAGVAVDYGFYLYLQPRQRPDEPYLERARRLIRPLLASALTTVIGFSFLLWSELPLIRQLGVFVSAGLICALATALLWFAQLDDSTLETRPFVRRRAAHPGAPARRASRALLALGAAIALLGPWRLHWRDDIRELQIPAPALEANDARVRALFGEGADKTVFLSRGTTPAEARDHLEAFLRWRDGTHPATAAATLGYAMPTQAQWSGFPARLESLGAFEEDFRSALERHGFDASGFSPFFEAWRSERREAGRRSYGQVAEALSGSLKGPYSFLFHVGPGVSWFATLAERTPGEDPPREMQTVTDEQLQNLNQLFSRYRASALRLSSVGLAFVGASVFLLYGIRRGARIFAIPAGACLFAFGVFGVAGATLNLFNLLGAFLGVCLSHNYAIFTAESQGRGEEPPPSIRMSAVAAASSFGVLSLSRIPVVASLGSTVAIIVLAALAITELTPLATSRDVAQHPGPQ